jgi:Tfp pilus assembly protein PilO
MKAQAPQWLKGKNNTLRTAALVFGCLAAMNLALYGFLVAPSIALQGTLEAKYSELRKRHAEAVLFQKQRAEFAGLQAGIPAQKDMPLLVKELVQTARRLNLAVDSVKYDIPKRTSGELAMLSFSFPIEGKYPDIKRFIYEIETADRLVGIQNVKLGAEQGKVKLEMKLLTYIKGQ